VFAISDEDISQLKLTITTLEHQCAELDHQRQEHQTERVTWQSNIEQLQNETEEQLRALSSRPDESQLEKHRIQQVIDEEKIEQLEQQLEAKEKEIVQAKETITETFQAAQAHDRQLLNEKNQEVKP
jgi:predicted ATPase